MNICSFLLLATEWLQILKVTEPNPSFKSTLILWSYWNYIHAKIILNFWFLLCENHRISFPYYNYGHAEDTLPGWTGRQPDPNPAALTLLVPKYPVMQMNISSAKQWKWDVLQNYITLLMFCSWIID